MTDIMGLPFYYLRRGLTERVPCRVHTKPPVSRVPGRADQTEGTLLVSPSAPEATWSQARDQPSSRFQICFQKFNSLPLCLQQKWNLT